MSLMLAVSCEVNARQVKIICVLVESYTACLIFAINPYFKPPKGLLLVAYP